FESTPRVSMPSRVRRPASLRSLFLTDTAASRIYTLSLHDALPISGERRAVRRRDRPLRRDGRPVRHRRRRHQGRPRQEDHGGGRDRKSTRLNSSHVKISYAVFCLKKTRAPDAIEATTTATLHSTPA